MKNLSIIIAHFNRKKILYKTLQAYSISENINDCEFVIVDDCSNIENNIKDIKKHFPSLNIKFIQIKPADKTWILPTVPFNLGVKAASHEKCIITNPECLPMGDVIKDAIETLKENTYQVYGCYSVNKAITYSILKTDITYLQLKDIRNRLPLTTEIILLQDGQNAWYQHSVHRPYKYCFCLGIYKNIYEKIGGLNDIYAKGRGFGDNDLVLAAIENKLKIIEKDEPFVLHLNHYDSIQQNYLNTNEAKRNLKIYNRRMEGEKITCDTYEKFYKKYLKTI